MARKTLQQRHTEWQEHNLTDYIERQIRYAFDSASEIIIRNVYQSICNYKTAFAVTDQDNFVHLCNRYIDAMRIMARREGINL